MAAISASAAKNRFRASPGRQPGRPAFVSVAAACSWAERSLARNSRSSMARPLGVGAEKAAKRAACASTDGMARLSCGVSCSIANPFLGSHALRYGNTTNWQVGPRSALPSALERIKPTRARSACSLAFSAISPRFSRLGPTRASPSPSRPAFHQHMDRPPVPKPNAGILAAKLPVPLQLRAMTRRLPSKTNDAVH